MQAAAETGRPQVSDLYIGVVAAGRKLVSVSFPVVGTEWIANWRIPIEILSRHVERLAAEGWILTLADRQGRVVARSRDAERWGGTPLAASAWDLASRSETGWSRATSLEGLPIYLGWRRLPFGWTALVGFEEQIVQQSAQELARRVTLGTLVVTVLGLSFAALAAAAVGRPLLRLSDVAEALKRGDVPAPRQTCVREIDIVGAALADAARARITAETTLRGREALLRSATDNAAVGLVMLDCERRYTFVNPAYPKILGLPYSASELIGKGPAGVLGPDYETQISPRLDRAFAGERVTYELARPRPGAAVNEADHYVVVYDPHRDPEGKVASVIVTIFDITERKRAEEHIHVIMKELSHRTKNLMAVVQAISWQTAQKSLDFDDFEQTFTQRLEALARSHDLLVKRDWRGVVLDDLVRAQLKPFLDSAEDRLVVRGPTLLLMPAAAQDLGLALHELATNASKYGALSVPTGKIRIRWTVDHGAGGAKCFHMTWRESGGPMINPPEREGFGSTVITKTLSRTFKGKAELEYAPEGVTWELTAPVDYLIEEIHLHLMSDDPLQERHALSARTSN